MTRAQQKNRELLTALCSADFEFVVVGGVAAVLHGSARLTVDLDVAAPFTTGNLSRLLDALRPHSPVHATRPDLSLLDEPMDRLLTFRLLLVETSLGRLDVLREVQPLGESKDLDTVEMTLLGRRVRVLSRGQLIRVKYAVGRPKDLEVARELEAIAEAED